MRKKDLANRLLLEVQKIFPLAQTELTNWSTPFQFLVCIVLSAQTTDIQVNKVTKKLFSKYPDAHALSLANLEELRHTLGGINYYKTKSKHILEMSKILHREYKGQPPVMLSKLLKLPGVGYKTANVFLNDLYKSNQGIAVDTHVLRVARAYGLTKHTDPTKISHDLEKLFKREDWYKVNSTFVLYGRYILKAKKPDMERVVLKEYLVI
ncbi:MAG: endonuclease III [Candidatus Dojkabacteria bacterium]|jgi:endonuclease-3|nr:endonuclease III [Candidatus Dojkabacteria bacterium]